MADDRKRKKALVYNVTPLQSLELQRTRKMVNRKSSFLYGSLDMNRKHERTFLTAAFQKLVTLETSIDKRNHIQVEKVRKAYFHNFS